MLLTLSARRRLRALSVVCLIGAGFSNACTSDEPRATPDEIARAERLYEQCVEEEIGIEVISVDIEPNGDISVEFGEGYTKAGEARAIAVCEARIASVLEPGSNRAPVLGPPRNLGRPGTDAEIERLLDERAELGFEGVILAEFQGAERVRAGFGKLGPGRGPAPDADTAFDCGSILKPVTVAVVFLLEQDGLLSRTDTLGDFFPDVPDVWRSVTIQQLITHSAGFDEYHDEEGDFEQMDRPTALARIFDQEPLFPAGTDRAYSNSGYTLLAILIEELTERGYRDVVRERVFEPLAMQRSGFYGDGRWEDGNVAVGRGGFVHGANDPARWPEPTWALMGNGGLVSTARDLLALAKGFDGDTLFQPATHTAFHRDFLEYSPAPLGTKDVSGYAGGNDFGFDAVVLHVREDASYVVAASHVLSAINAEILGIEALQVLYGAVLELPED
jgi:CubicO group peptidase (beta-lactamase class C family)